MATLYEKVKGTPQQPLGAAQASSLGATPMQAAMAGSEAAKVKKEKTLLGAQRLDESAPATPTQAQKAETQKAETISTLGAGIQGRAKTATEARVNTSASALPVTPAIRQTVLGTSLGMTPEQIAAAKADPNSKYNKAAAALTSFSTAKDEGSKNVAISALQQLGIQLDAVPGLLETSLSAVTGGITQATKAPLKLTELNLQGIAPGINNLDDLSKTLGVPVATLQGMSVEELPQLITDIQQKEFAKGDTLRAQIAATPPGPQRDILLRELQQIEGSGVSAAEQKVGQAVQAIDTEATIKIGDSEYSISDVLGDDTLSGVVSQWIAASPEDREKIIPSGAYPGLVSWLTTHEQALGELSQEMSASTTAYQTTEQAKETLGQVGNIVLPQDLVDALSGGPTKPGETAAQVAARKAAIEASAVGQIAKEGKTDLVNQISSASPEIKAHLLKQPKEVLDAAWAAGQALVDPQVAELSGVKSSDGFVLTSADRRKVADYKTAIDSANAHDATWLNEPFFKALPPKDMVTLVKNPTRFDTLRTYEDTKKTLESLLVADTKQPKTMDSLLQKVSGIDTLTSKDLNDTYKEVSRMAALGDPLAIKQKKKLETELGFSDKKPVLGESQAKTLRSKLADIYGTFSRDKVIAGKTIDVPDIDILSGRDDLFSGKVAKSELYNTFSKELLDSDLSAKEIKENVNNGNGEKLIKLLKGMPNSKELLKVYEDVLNKINKEKKDAETAAKEKKFVTGVGDSNDEAPYIPTVPGFFEGVPGVSTTSNSNKPVPTVPMTPEQQKQLESVAPVTSSGFFAGVPGVDTSSTKQPAPRYVGRNSAEYREAAAEEGLAGAKPIKVGSRAFGDL